MWQGLLILCTPIMAIWLLVAILSSGSKLMKLLATAGIGLYMLTVILYFIIAGARITMASKSQHTSTTMNDNGRLPASTPYAMEITTAAMKHDIDPLLLAAVVESESAFNATAVSKAGAEGLGQLMPATARACGVRDSFNVEQNLDCAAWLLSYLLDKFNDDTSLALAAYNSGEGTVGNCMCIPQNGETNVYVPRVLAAYEKYQSQQQTTVSSSEIVWPYRHQPRITGGLHGLSNWEGVDVSAGCGTELVAPLDGIVTYNALDGYVGPYAKNGEQNTMLTIYGDGVEATLLHGVYDVAIGDIVSASETRIGYEASIGNSTGCHTHFITKVDGGVVNPLSLIEGGQ